MRPAPKLVQALLEDEDEELSSKEDFMDFMSGRFMRTWRVLHVNYGFREEVNVYVLRLDRSHPRYADYRKYSQNYLYLAPSDFYYPTSTYLLFFLKPPQDTGRAGWQAYDPPPVASSQILEDIGDQQDVIVMIGTHSYFAFTADQYRQLQQWVIHQ